MRGRGTSRSATVPGSTGLADPADRGRSLGKIDLLWSDRMTKKGLRLTGTTPGGRIRADAGRMAGIR